MHLVWDPLYELIYLATFWINLILTMVSHFTFLKICFWGLWKCLFHAWSYWFLLPKLQVFQYIIQLENLIFCFSQVLSSFFLFTCNIGFKLFNWVIAKFTIFKYFLFMVITKLFLSLLFWRHSSSCSLCLFSKSLRATHILWSLLSCIGNKNEF